nr:MAG TPA: hypothetical protein [Caudoviricetes sp.]
MSFMEKSIPAYTMTRILIYSNGSKSNPIGL